MQQHTSRPAMDQDTIDFIRGAFALVPAAFATLAGWTAAPALALAALKAGFHVLLEKPVAVHQAQVAQTQRAQIRARPLVQLPDGSWGLIIQNSWNASWGLGGYAGPGDPVGPGARSHGGSRGGGFRGGGRR